jgi:hypothetical protein
MKNNNNLSALLVCVGFSLVMLAFRCGWIKWDVTTNEKSYYVAPTPVTVEYTPSYPQYQQQPPRFMGGR